MNLVDMHTFLNEVRKLRKDKCESCGSIQNLHLHHKDMMTRSDENYFDLDRNTQDNTMTLCRSCHSIEHSKAGTGQFSPKATEIRRQACLTRNKEDNPMNYEESKQKMIDSLTGRLRYTNGVTNIMCFEGDQPDGYYLGLTRREDASEWIRTRERAFDNETGKARYLKEDEWYLIGTKYKKRLVDTDYKKNNDKPNSEGSSTIERR